MARGAGAPHAVERNRESAPPDGIDVDHRQRQDRVEVPLDRPRVLAHGPDVVPPGPGRTLLRQRAHRVPGFGIEKNSVRPHELQRIPLDGIVAGGQDQTGPGVVVLHRQLHRGGGNDPEIDHVHPDRHEAGRGRPGEHGAAGAGIPPQDDGGMISSRTV